MKELTELEHAIKWHKEFALAETTLFLAAQRLITRLKECEFGKCEMATETGYDGIMYFLPLGDAGHKEQCLGKSGQLYFVPEESET